MPFFGVADDFPLIRLFWRGSHPLGYCGSSHRSDLRTYNIFYPTHRRLSKNPESELANLDSAG